MECGVPKCGNQRLDDFRREVEPIDDDDGKHFLNMVHEAGKHSGDSRPDEEKRRIDLNLAHQGSRSLVFPDDVEVRLQASESEDKRYEKAGCADKTKFSDGNVFRIFDDIHDLFCRPVQVEHVDHDGEIIRNKVSEPDCKRNRGEHNQKGDYGHERCIGQGSRAGHPMIIQERLSGNDHDFYERRRTGCYIVEQPFPGKIFPPVRHKPCKYS